MVNNVGMCIVRLTMGNPIAWHIIYIITQENTMCKSFKCTLLSSEVHVIDYSECVGLIIVYI
jgi:hypothetical protein